MSTYILEIAILIAALYLLFTGIKMKKTGKIPKSVMGEDLLKNCLDEKGFTEELFPWMMVFSIATLVGTLVGVLLEHLGGFAWATYMICGIFFVVFILFCVQYKRAIKKYFKEM